MKEGFKHAADLRPALQLFAAHELKALMIREIWIKPAAVLRALKFTGWVETDSTPVHFRELIKRWGSAPATREGKLRNLLMWATGSDELPDDVSLMTRTTKPHETLHR